MPDISIRTNIKEIERKLSNLAYKQVPFATAQALNALLTGLKKAEQKNELHVFKTATPFTLNSVGITRATKASAEGTLYMKPVAAAYMQPFEFGGKHALNKGNSNELVPIDNAIINGYGNIPRTFLSSMKGRSDVFVGPVATRNGVVYGVWQRTAALDRKGRPQKAEKVSYKKPPKPGALARLFKKAPAPVKVTRKVKGLASLNGRSLKLLIAFRKPTDVTQKLGWFDTAQTHVKKNFNREFGKALGKALASAK